MESGDRGERREHSRALLDIALEVCLLNGEDSAKDFCLLPCSGRDISGGGISFYAPRRYPPESLLRLCIPLPNTMALGQNGHNNPLKVMGKVMWCKRNREADTYVVGVQFLNIYEKDYHFLNDYVQKLLRS
ncbi:MAG: PilZ domain-containing protein [Proteobacteria bacterium]|nr:PilZ domain-containing protein [Pseudomonadota bacterium]MBU1059340.1 PilZ domain-containing protein [Pseudomonadota bacterium]